MVDLRHLLAIYVHAHQAGNAVPPHIDADARTALAAEPAFAASEPSDEDLADLSEVFNGDPLPAMRRALELWGRPTIAALAAEPPAPDPRAALAARPLLEAVARLGDCIGQHTVGEIATISDRAAAWLAENPPGQPVAIEPRGCPTPGACSCVEPPAPAEPSDFQTLQGIALDMVESLRPIVIPEILGVLRKAIRQPAAPVPVADAGECTWIGRDGQSISEREWLADWVENEAPFEYGSPNFTRAAALLREPAPAPVPGEEYHDDMGDVLWWRFPIEEPPYAGTPLDDDWPGYHTHFTPLAIPQPPQGGEVP